MSSSNQTALSSYPPQSGFASGLFVGLVLGGILGYFFQTESGQKLLAQLKSQAQASLEDLSDKDKLEEKLHQLQDFVETKLESPPTSPPPRRPRFFRRGDTPLKP